MLLYVCLWGVYKQYEYVYVFNVKSFQINILSLPYWLLIDTDFVDSSNVLFSNSYLICEVNETIYIKYKPIICNS